MAHYHVTEVSSNSKVGPITVTTQSRDTCPSTCPLLGSVCYAEHGPLAWHWRKVDAGRGEVDWDAFVDCVVRGVRRTGMLRLSQAGDLPHEDERVDWEKVQRLDSALAAEGCSAAWTYSHHREIAEDGDAQDRVKALRVLTVNASAHSVEEAQALQARGIPAVAVVPEGETVRGCVVCPHNTGKAENCKSCGNGRPLCSRGDRRFPVLFWEI